MSEQRIELARNVDDTRFKAIMATHDLIGARRVHDAIRATRDASIARSGRRSAMADSMLGRAGEVLTEIEIAEREAWRDFQSATDAYMAECNSELGGDGV